MTINKPTIAIELIIGDFEATLELAMASSIEHTPETGMVAASTFATETKTKAKLTFILFESLKLIVFAFFIFFILRDNTYRTRWTQRI